MKFLLEIDDEILRYLYDMESKPVMNDISLALAKIGIDNINIKEVKEC